jgi:hypothetical protein
MLLSARAIWRIHADFAEEVRQAGDVLPRSAMFRMPAAAF